MAGKLYSKYLACLFLLQHTNTHTYTEPEELSEAQITYALSKFKLFKKDFPHKYWVKLAFAIGRHFGVPPLKRSKLRNIINTRIEKVDIIITNWFLKKVIINILRTNNYKRKRERNQNWVKYMISEDMGKPHLLHKITPTSQIHQVVQKVIMMMRVIEMSQSTNQGEVMSHMTHILQVSLFINLHLHCCHRHKAKPPGYLHHKH